MDAVVVVTLMESSMQSAALISADNCLHSSFPCDAMLEYKRQSNQRCSEFRCIQFGNFFLINFF
jgi:hypothetical protein